jgi:hypothetical protein
MTCDVALLIDPYRGMFKIVDTANDDIEAWQRAVAARHMLQGGIFVVLSTETREDPNPLNHKSRSMLISGASGAYEHEWGLPSCNSADDRRCNLPPGNLVTGR